MGSVKANRTITWMLGRIRTKKGRSCSMPQPRATFCCAISKPSSEKIFSRAGYKTEATDSPTPLCSSRFSQCPKQSYHNLCTFDFAALLLYCFLLRHFFCTVSSKGNCYHFKRRCRSKRSGKGHWLASTCRRDRRLHTPRLRERLVWWCECARGDGDAADVGRAQLQPSA